MANGNDLSRITREMYKKNLELVERNKMLALLRSIDQIILSSLNKVEQIADQVTKQIIKKSNIKSIFIYLKDDRNDILKPLSVAFAKETKNVSDDVFNIYYSEKIFLSDEKNPLIEAIKTKKIIKLSNMKDIFHQIDSQIVEKTQREIGIVDFLLHPFFVRNKTSGVIVFGFGEKEVSTQYWEDFITRLPEVISIAIDDAILYQEIQDDNEKLKMLDKLKDEFVSVASHELRTPMTAIKNYLYLAIKKAQATGDVEINRYLDISYASSERLLKLVEDMLTVSRIEGKRLMLKIESVNLNEIVKQVLEEFIVIAKDKKIAFNFNPAATVMTVSGDKERLTEVVQNILGNALKFTPIGGHIDVNFSEKGNYSVIEIFNSDSYISPEDIAKLFEKFRQLETKEAGQSTAHGTGLGLYISKQIVEMHHGRIEVVSEENKGSSFIIFIPKSQENN